MALDLTDAFTHPLTELKEATAAAAFSPEDFTSKVNEIDGITTLSA